MVAVFRSIDTGVKVIRRINPLHIFIDAGLIALSLYMSVFLRVSWNGLMDNLPMVTSYLPLFIALRLSTMFFFGIYNFIWRYISASDVTSLAKSIGFSTICILAMSYMIDMGRLPRSAFLIDTLLVTAFLGGARLAVRLRYENIAGRRRKDQDHGRRTLIYGAGVTGLTLAQHLTSDVESQVSVVGFIDDDPEKVGRRVSGFRVLGNKSDLASIIEKYKVQNLVVAISNVNGEVLRDIVQIAKPYGILPRTLNHTAFAGTTQPLRDIELRDLLCRPQTSTDLSSVRDMVRGKRVLVTGAGGSIGSELARQILSFDPSRLLLLDHAEYNLYEIDRELRSHASADGVVVPLLIDIKTIKTLRTVMKEYSPEIVFHAAAYKHVHLVESNPYPSILNNVLGTKNLIDVSEEVGVESFVLISTDKAVNPAGIMGATKRVCELMVAAAGERTKKRYCAVRFGNVLGSSGSLIPLLQQQIKNGGPVTVTHKDMTRYFMLIPEAVSLVLKAATIAKPGDINILRMGEPVKILDITRSLIALMGKTEKEIPIVFTGLRPGEKMFEELYLSGNELNTEHPDILVLPKGDAASTASANASSQEMDSDQLFASLEKLINAAQIGSKEAIYELNSLVKSTYVHPEHIEKPKLTLVGKRVS